MRHNRKIEKIESEWEVSMIYFKTAKLRSLKKFFNENGYVYGFLVDINEKSRKDDMSGTKWKHVIKTFKNFKKALSWYLAGSGVRSLGDDYDRTEFKEIYNMGE